MASTGLALGSTDLELKELYGYGRAHETLRAIATQARCTQQFRRDARHSNEMECCNLLGFSKSSLAHDRADHRAFVQDDQRDR